MPRLIHKTSLDIAIVIIRTGVFKAARGGDAGINAFVEGKPKNLNQYVEATGATLKFNWSGPVRVNNTFPLEPNTLHEDLPWRAVVPVGTTRHLIVIGLDADDDVWAEAVGATPSYCLTSRMKAAYRHERAKLLKQETEDRIKTRPSVVVR